MKKQSKPKFKSIFVLHVYKYGWSKDKLAYHIDQDEQESKGGASPGIDIWECDVGYFQTLQAAEKRIKKIAGEDQEGLYSFLIEEKPQECMIRKGDYLTIRRYLLWQESKVSTIREYDGKNCELGDTCFYGRDLRTIPFKEGDIVEIARKDFMELGIIWDLPATKKRMKRIWSRYIKQLGPDIAWVHPDDSDDGYTVVGYSLGKDGKIGFGHSHPAVVDVLPPSLPVPKKYAQQLRKCLRSLKKEEAVYILEREKEKQVPNKGM